MNIRILNNGSLSIERSRGVFVTQICPWVPYSEQSGFSECKCGHWCPLFGEPTEEGLQICRTFLKGPVEDLREEKKP